MRLPRQRPLRSSEGKPAKAKHVALPFFLRAPRILVFGSHLGPLIHGSTVAQWQVRACEDPLHRSGRSRNADLEDQFNGQAVNGVRRRGQAGPEPGARVSSPSSDSGDATPARRDDLQPPLDHQSAVSRRLRCGTPGPIGHGSAVRESARTVRGCGSWTAPVERARPASRRRPAGRGA